MRIRNRNALRRWRLQRGYSQRELAFLCGKTQATISHLENGLMTTCSDDLAVTISRRLNVPLEELFEAPRSLGMPEDAIDSAASCEEWPPA